MKQLLNDVKAMTLIVGSAAVSLGATALFLRAEPSSQQAECLANVPDAVSSISISPGGAVTVVLPGGEGESLTVCARGEDQGRKRHKRQRDLYAGPDRERIQDRLIKARERAEEAAVHVREARIRADEVRVRTDEIQGRIQEAKERAEEARHRVLELEIDSEFFDEHEIEDAIEQALESIDEQEIEDAIERALEFLDDGEIESRIEERLRRLEERLERIGNGGD